MPEVAWKSFEKLQKYLMEQESMKNRTSGVQVQTVKVFLQE